MEILPCLILTHISLMYNTFPHITFLNITTICHILTRSQDPSWTQVGSESVKQRNCLELGARSQLSALKGVEGHAETPGWD
jgi:hypothetical protein